jgi:periplasmic copper chaperone A
MVRHLIGLLVVALVAVISGATPALAHVEVGESSVDPNGAATVTFTFDHGCTGQPTDSLRVQIPAGVTNVVPAPVDGWQIAVTPTEFSWTGGSIPDHQEASFTAAMQVSGPAGTTIWFPTVQGCGSDEEAWIEIPATGGAEPENVAPSIVLAADVQTPPTTPPSNAAPSTTRTTLVPGEAAVTKEGSPTNNTGLVVGLVAVGAIVIGAVVLFLRYRGTGNTTR